jgi:hypothetical protein
MTDKNLVTNGIGYLSEVNSTVAPLDTLATFPGKWIECFAFASITVAAKTDQDGVLYIDFSPDGRNSDSTLTYSVTAGTSEVHRLSVTRPYCRVRFYNSSASPQTYLRLTTLFGMQPPLTSALNTSIQQDADTLVVRPLDFNLMVAESLYQNHQNTIKDGFNPDVSTATVPEDMWSAGGTYTGFPTGAVEAGEIVVAGADTGTVYYSYLASDTSTDYVFGSKAIAGAGSYALGHNIWRCNFAYFVSTNTGVFNVGLITIRNTVTTANVFVQIPIGYSQSYTSAYTVPYGSSIFLDRVSGNLQGGATATQGGVFWYRPYGESPRLRFPFTFQQGSFFFDDVDYLVRIPQRVDLIPRIISCTANNVSSQISYRLIKVKD